MVDFYLSRLKYFTFLTKSQYIFAPDKGKPRVIVGRKVADPVICRMAELPEKSITYFISLRTSFYLGESPFYIYQYGHILSLIYKIRLALREP